MIITYPAQDQFVTNVLAEHNAFEIFEKQALLQYIQLNLIYLPSSMSTLPIYKELKQALSAEAKIADDAWDDLADSSEICEIKKGDKLFTAGETNASVYFIMSGLIRLYYLREDGREFNKSFLKPGDIAGVLDLGNKPAAYSADCIQDSITVRLPYSAVEKLCNLHPCWKKLKQRVFEKVANKKQRREQQLLTEDATIRYQYFLEEFGELANEIPLFQIASYLGITNVALSRIRKQLDLIA